MVFLASDSSLIFSLARIFHTKLPLVITDSKSIKYNQFENNLPNPDTYHQPELMSDQKVKRKLTPLEEQVIDLKSRLNITLAAYDIKGKLLYVDEAASANIFQICNGSFIEFDAALNFGTRYDLC